MQDNKVTSARSVQKLTTINNQSNLSVMQQIAHTVTCFMRWTYIKPLDVAICSVRL